MNLQSKFGYCITTLTLNIALCKRGGITDRRTEKRMNRQMIQLLDVPGGLNSPGALKRWSQSIHKALNLSMYNDTDAGVYK